MTRVDVIESIVIPLVLLLAVGLLIKDDKDLRERNASLQQQLEQAQEQLADAKQLAGKPINIADLPDGSWSVFEDDQHAFVVKDGGNPFEPTIVAVHFHNGIPQHFATADVRKQVAEFLKENPPAKSPATSESLLPETPVPVMK